MAHHRKQPVMRYYCTFVLIFFNWPQPDTS